MTPNQESPRAARDRRGLLVAPAVVVVLAVFCLPAVLIVARSVTDPQLGFQNFQWLLGNDTALAVLVRTLVVATMATGICLILGYPFAYLMTIAGPGGRGLLTLLVLMPFWTSLMVRTFAWVIILQDNGVLNAVLGAVGLPQTSLLRSTPGVLIGMCQILLPFMVLPLYAGMRGIDRRLLQAGQSLGAPPWKTFLTVYLPLSTPGVLAGSLMVFILSLGFYVTPAILGSPRQELLPNALASEISDLLNWGHGGALAVALLVCAVAMLTLTAWVSRRVTGSGTTALRLTS
jgi:putative spermidine/putrescine transport system permease protein